MEENPAQFRLGGPDGTGTTVLSLDGELSRSMSDEEIRELRLKNEFFPDAQERFNQTLESRGYEQVTTLENGYQYPTVDEMIAWRIENGDVWAPGYFAFVRQKGTDEILFCKTRVKPQKEQLGGGFARESEVLETVEGLPAPKVVGYYPEDSAKNELELLVLTAIPFSEGSVRTPEEWTPEASANAAHVIKGLETRPPLLDMPELPPTKEVVANLLERTAYILPEFLRKAIETVTEAYQPLERSVFAHGDLWPKNIIVGRGEDAKLTVVDWEMAGRGYAGQDAGRFWWGISSNGCADSAASREFLSSYLSDLTPEEHDAQRTQLLFGVVHEILMRFDDIRLAPLKDPEARPEEVAKAQAKVESIQAQAITMLNTVATLAPQKQLELKSV